MGGNPTTTEKVEPVPLSQRLETTINRLIGSDGKIDKDALNCPWDESMCLALKMDVGENPRGLNGEQLVDESYRKLVSLLGTPTFDKFPLAELKSRIIFTKPEVITAFRFFFEQPGANNDKYWGNPIKRTINNRGVEAAFSMVSTHAATLGNAGVILIPTETIIDEEQARYLDKTGVTKDEYPHLDVKRGVAHELVHLLYGKIVFRFALLTEQFCDYMAMQVFPEIRVIDIRHEWAEASINDFLNRLGHKSVGEFFRSLPNLREDVLLKASKETDKKYFSKTPYSDMGWPEEMLQKIGRSKYATIPIPVTVPDKQL